MLFDTQKEWAASDDPTVVVENLKKIGRTAGMDDAAMDACLNDQANGRGAGGAFRTNMTADESKARRRFSSTAPNTNMAYDELKAILDAELAK